MKNLKLLLSLLLFVGGMPQVIHAQTEKAIYAREQTWDDENKKFKSKSDKYTLYFVYDRQTYDGNHTNIEDPEKAKNKYYFVKWTDPQNEEHTDTILFSSSKTGFLNVTYGNEITPAPWRTNSNWNSIERIVFADSFSGCTSLSYAYWFKANTTTVLKKVDGGRNIITVDTAKGRYTASFDEMFEGQRELETIDDVSTWLPEGNHVQNIHCMFNGCNKLQSTPTSPLNVDNWDTSYIKGFIDSNGMERDMRYVFNNCQALEILNINTKKVTKEDGTTYTAWDVSKVKSMYGMFNGCTGLTTLDLSNWTPTSVKFTTLMFNGCTKLENIGFGDEWDTPALTNTNAMFKGCSSLERLSFADNFNTENVTDMRNMFDGCSNLKSITFGKKFTMNNVSSANAASMFYNCPKLRYIDFFNCNYSYTATCQPLNSVSRSNNTFNGVPKTTVIYLPVRYGEKWTTFTAQNVVYTDTLNIPYTIPLNGSTSVGLKTLYRSRCAEYYSEDKVDIEFPRDFTTLKADYIRPMANEYGSVILPYRFKKNGYVQPYMQNLENNESNQMHFKDVETVPAHTPFAFKKLSAASDGVHFTNTGENKTDTVSVSGKKIDRYQVVNGELIPIYVEYNYTKTYDNYTLTVNATRSTNSDETTWNPETHIWTNSTTETGSPYSTNNNINQEKLSGWSTKGYYVNQTLNSNTDGPFFYIAQEKFKSANGNVTLPPHRVTFHNANLAGDGANTFSIMIDSNDDEVMTAIKQAETEQTIREAEAIYDPAGRRHTEMQKGLNIVRMSDGTVKKVIIK